MNSKADVVLSPVLYLLAGVTAWTASPATLPATFDVAAIDAYLAAQVDQAPRAGLSVALVKDGALESQLNRA